MGQSIIVRRLGLLAYDGVWRSMIDFTNQRTAQTSDELWLVQHHPVFTQGQAGRAEHLLSPGEIPVVPTDRGGQVTYHGPGQLVVYPLLDLRRLKLGVRELVTAIENSVIDYLKHWQLTAYAKPDAPGVYVDESKIASLGLRVRKGCSFHGVSLNVDMDLTPFSRINPCGYQGLQMAQLADYADIRDTPYSKIETDYANCLATALGDVTLEWSQSSPKEGSMGREV